MARRASSWLAFLAMATMARRRPFSSLGCPGEAPPHPRRRCRCLRWCHQRPSAQGWRRWRSGDPPAGEVWIPQSHEESPGCECGDAPARSAWEHCQRRSWSSPSWAVTAASCTAVRCDEGHDSASTLWVACTRPLCGWSRDS
jgi:hypothetical protein